MAENPTNEMGDRIERTVKQFAVAFGLFSLIPFIVAHFNDFILILKSTDFDKLKNILEDLLLPLANGAILFIVALLRRLDLHNFLDQRTIKARERVGLIIQNELIAAAKKLHVNDSKIAKLHGSVKLCMDIFYYFANQQKEKRELAFSYWETYFVYLYIFILCPLSAIAFAIVAIKENVFGQIYWLEIIPTFLLLSFAMRLRSLLGKMRDLPRSQIADALATDHNAVRHQIESRT